MAKRTIQIEFNTDSDDEYNSIANMLWHILEFKEAGRFHVEPDRASNPADLNAYWDGLSSFANGKPNRWT